MLSRYGSLDYVKTLSIKFLYRLVVKAKEQKENDKLFKMYCSVLPYIEKMTFEEWKKKSIKGTKNFVDMRSTDDIMKDLLGGDF